MKATVSTSRNADAPAESTVFEVDFTDCTTDILQRIAFSALVIKRQTSWRKKGIPAQETIKAADYAPGVRHAEVPLTPEQMTPEQRQIMLKKLMELEGMEIVEQAPAE